MSHLPAREKTDLTFRTSNKYRCMCVALKFCGENRPTLENKPPFPLPPPSPFLNEVLLFPLKYAHLQLCCSLVPRPSPAPVSDRLQYAETEPGESYYVIRGTGVTCCHAYMYKYSPAREKTDLTFRTSNDDKRPQKKMKRTKHIRARRGSSEGLLNDV